MTKRTVRGAAASLALATLATAAFAQSQDNSVEVYGLVGVYVGSTKKSGDANSVTQVGGGGLTTSFIGFRGKEDLGGGLKASFGLESFLRPDTGSQGRSSADPFWSRNAWVGLDGGFGRVAFGRQTNPIYLMMLKLSPFGTSVVFSPLVLHSFVANYGPSGAAVVKGDTVWDNAVQYAVSPIQGLQVGALYAPGEVAGRGSVSNSQVYGNYSSGALTIAAAHQRLRVTSTAVLPETQATTLVGGAYDWGPVKTFANWIRSDQDNVAKSRQVDAGLSVPVTDKGSVLLEGSRVKVDLAAGTKYDRTTYALGYDHRLSRRTDVYAVLLSDARRGSSQATSRAVGIRHSF